MAFLKVSLYPVTTAGVITKKRFLNGYMEVKAKVGNAAITGAFWAIGYEQELDVFELMGNPKLKGDIREDSYKATIHDWSPPAIRPTWAYKYSEKKLPFRVADDFHIYGAEWGEDYLKLFIDGKLVNQITQDELGTDWVLNNPMEIWLDSEIFKWLGLPHKEELPVDFEIEYLRVWQKPTTIIYWTELSLVLKAPFYLRKIPGHWIYCLKVLYLMTIKSFG